MTSSYLIRKKPLPFRGHSTNSSGNVGTSKSGPVMTGPHVSTPQTLIQDGGRSQYQGFDPECLYH